MEFEDGLKMHAKNIVGCDGVKSIVRDSLFSKNLFASVYSGIYVWTQGLPKHLIKGVYGDNINILNVPLSETESACLMVTKRKIDPAEDVAEICKELTKRESEVFKTISNHFTFDKKPILTLIRRVKPFKFYKRNVTLLGDAAHGETPILGWGTTIAIEDAYTLGKLIAENKQATTKAFREYYLRRKRRVKYLHLITSLEERFLGLMDSRYSRVRNIFFFLFRPFLGISYAKIRDLYLKVHSYNID